MSEGVTDLGPRHVPRIVLGAFSQIVEATLDPCDIIVMGRCSMLGCAAPDGGVVVYDPHYELEISNCYAIEVRHEPWPGD